MTDDSTRKGAAVYNAVTLALYDAFVLGFSNAFAWRAPTRSILASYDREISNNHLDVGVGTGYFLDACRFPHGTPSITLMDLNATSLAVAAKRLRRYGPRTIVADALEPLPATLPRFDSIGLNYLLHCLPGTMRAKKIVFENMRSHLAPGGRLFGTTILGQGVQHNMLGRALVALYNRRGIFGNSQDSPEALEENLAECFSDFDLEIHGTVAFFVGRV